MSLPRMISDINRLSLDLNKTSYHKHFPKEVSYDLLRLLTFASNVESTTVTGYRGQAAV